MIRIAFAILSRCLEPGERDEVLDDVGREYATRRSRDGGIAARRWLWRQALGSVPGAFRRGWQRGSTGFVPESERLRGGGGVVEGWLLDARFALRGLRTRRQYTVLSVLTLALGLGGTTAVFGVARTLLLSPLPYGDEDGLVMFWHPYDWRESEFTLLRGGGWPGLEGVAAYWPEGAFMREPGRPARLVPGLVSSAELFDVLGARPLLGRTFAPGDDAVGAAPVAVLSWGLWQELGGRADVVGSVLTLNGVAREVVGVMPPGFWFPDPTVRLWMSTPMRADDNVGRYTLVGRLEPGATAAGMTEPLRRITERLSANFTYPAEWDKTRNASLTPLRDHLLGPVRPVVLATLAAMAVILLMACANVATLMLAQLRGRASELAVRVALGAGRRRLAQQLLVEAALLALVAGVVGAVAASAGFSVLVAALPLGVLGDVVAADYTLYAASLGLACIVTLLVGLAPVFSLWRGELRDTLATARTGGIGGRSGRLEDALVVGEVALAVLLAVGAAVLIRSVDNLRAIDDGIDAYGVAVIDVAMSGDVPPAVRLQRLRDLVEIVRTVPGVQAAATVDRLALRDRGGFWGLAIEDRPDMPMTTTAFRTITGDWFDVMGVPLRAGRVFDATDRADGEPVLVVDELFARTYFPGEDAIGRRVSHGGDPFRIIGVVGTVPAGGLTDERVPTRYVLNEQMGHTRETAVIVLRAGAAASADAVLQDAVRRIQTDAGDIAVRGVATMESVVTQALGPTHRIMQLMTMLGTLALALGAVGVYGVVTHYVHRRRRDWVIRMALGMKPLDAVRQVVGRGMILALAGCAIGSVAALAGTRVLASLLYDVRPGDPAALAAALAALLAAVLLAALVPALRAARVDPAHVLRDAP